MLPRNRALMPGACTNEAAPKNYRTFELLKAMKQRGDPTATATPLGMMKPKARAPAAGRVRTRIRYRKLPGFPSNLFQLLSRSLRFARGRSCHRPMA